MPAGSRTSLLLEIVDQAYDKHAWHGTTLRGSLRGVTAKQALWKPAPGRPSIWQLTLHCAYWKYNIARKISGDESMSFPRQGANFPALPKPADAAAWKKDVALLGRWHKTLRKAVERFADAGLNARARKSRYRHKELIYGIASHDLYHAGQIQLLKRLQQGRKKKRR